MTENKIKRTRKGEKENADFYKIVIKRSLEVRSKYFYARMHVYLLMIYFMQVVSYFFSSCAYDYQKVLS